LIKQFREFSRTRGGVKSSNINASHRAPRFRQFFHAMASSVILALRYLRLLVIRHAYPTFFSCIDISYMIEQPNSFVLSCSCCLTSLQLQFPTVLQHLILASVASA
jgi:hypothetical protein